MRVGIYGTGAYGLALSSILADNNNEITMWTKFEEEKDLLVEKRGNDKLLPGYKLDESIKITTSIEECADDKDLLVIVIPAAFVRDLCVELKKYVNENTIICIASKGIEQNTGLFISEIVTDVLGVDKYGVLSGPSFAKDVIAKKPIGLTLATPDSEAKNVINEAFRNEYTKTRSTFDVYGTEVCGAIKNVIALASGMLTGLGANESTRAMLITESLQDIVEMIRSLNGDGNTILSFAGFGDLLLTCTSTNSRNYSYGKLVGEGKSKEELDEYLKTTTVEGYYTLESIYKLLKDKEVSIPIIDLIYSIIKENNNPEELLKFLVEKV